MDPIVARHLLVSLAAHYDFTEPFAPYSLHHLLFQYGPADGTSYPFVLSELWLFTRLEGAGTHDLWVDILRLTDGDLMATYGPFLVPFGSDPVSVSRAWCLRGVPFEAAGWYEFSLRCGEDILATEPVYLQE